MNGDKSAKTAAVNKVKQVAGAAQSAATSAASATAQAAAVAANGGNKKRRKDLKPIITGESSPAPTGPGGVKRCVPDSRDGETPAAAGERVFVRVDSVR